MRRAEPRLRAAVQWVWQHSVARLAKLDIAVPKTIALAERGEHVGHYLWAAIRAGAPCSTAAMVVATLVATACHVGQSFLLGQLTEQALIGRREQVTFLLLTLMSLWLAGPLLQALHSLARLYASQNLRIVVTDHLSARLMHAHPRQVADNSVGNLVERIELTSSNLPSVVCTATDTLVKLFSVAVLASLVMAGVSTPMALLAGTWMLMALLLSSYLAYTGMNIVEDASDAHAQVIAELAELVTNIPLIRSFTAQAMERRRFGTTLQADLYACRRVRSYWVFVLLIEAAFKWLFGLAVTLYAVQQYGTGHLLLPQLITICSLIIALSWHFESVAFHFVDLFDALGVLRSGLRELAAIDIDLGQDSQPLPKPGGVLLENVTVSYNKLAALRNVSLQIEPGSKVGIVGPSGSGKSSLLAVLRGDLLPDSGRVELHGAPLANCSAEQLARASSEALQNALMFNRSVRENVAYSAAEQVPGAIEHALSAAQARQLVLGLPQGLDTEVGERGASLSTGERQRLSIARALLKHAPLVVFDEATSSVDTIAEACILDHLVDEMSGNTVIVVTHRVATLKRFDLIVVMDQGRIVETGTPQELLATSSLFQRLQHHEDDSDDRHQSSSLFQS
ncbi:MULTISPECIES: ABC transporter ATP-binding protein [unclassified Undibacterium]|uniref:ABC transporter ATP-binding protein n=1 Tax=unclassified Undibacterium TaxID=2630295 RepID=UPI002AC8FAC5|nr:MULTISPECIES: ABC transporter ATP-binding protein [unclassified Undibacterium]MEB0137683.1 ABC transporter ATP-binding protein [Undibacterium sp. CCC2.1]MEB0172665.1 ABC transporter ATP-binding protein [Undibacterium sp. CCC1.1]MEB0177598.1 ABC transporter ATP-binding protein [Undibacterium sp. CCC3.4]MEB0215460.1 ABC transporter ATP-binding protein [Undibacterium sp. 5I2]WPX42257.1 ABC transporter ATP-binding protein [Undibacterium sp. CCC3.4]